MPPPPDNVVPLDIDAIPDLYPLKTTEPPTTPKLFGFKNVDSYFQFQVEQKSQVVQEIFHLTTLNKAATSSCACFET